MLAGYCLLVHDCFRYRSGGNKNAFILFVLFNPLLLQSKERGNLDGLSQIQLKKLNREIEVLLRMVSDGRSYFTGLL